MDWTELGQRAVACRAWRWMPGMFVGLDRPVPFERIEQRLDGTRAPYYPGCLPDLRDPATLGCLLALVREAWGSHVEVRRGVYGQWLPVGIGSDNYGRDRVARTSTVSLPGCGWCPTEAEALVVALEAAP